MVLEFIRERTTALPVILYPGDPRSHGSPHESQAAIQRYSEAYREATTRLRESASTSVGDLLALGRSYAERISSKNSRLFFCLSGPVSSACTIKLWDLEQSFVLDIYRGLTGPIAAPDGSSQNGKNGVISTHSSSLAYLLRFEWGFDTLMVNGRFRADRAAYSKVVRTLSIEPLTTRANAGNRAILEHVADPKDLTSSCKFPRTPATAVRSIDLRVPGAPRKLFGMPLGTPDGRRIFGLDFVRATAVLLVVARKSPRPPGR